MYPFKEGDSLLLDDGLGPNELRVDALLKTANDFPEVDFSNGCFAGEEIEETTDRPDMERVGELVESAVLGLDNDDGFFTSFFLVIVAPKRPFFA